MRRRVIQIGALCENMAIVRVPIVLNRDATMGGLDVDATISPVADEDGYLKLACSKWYLDAV